MHANPPLLNTLNARIGELDTALENALSNGDDTSALRKQRADLSEKRERLLVKSREIANDEAAKATGVQQAEAKANAQQYLNDANRVIKTLLKQVNAYQVDIDASQMEALELHRLQSQLAVDNASADLQAKTDYRAKLKQRLSAINAERQGVIDRRMSGDCIDSDAADLALLDADREGLNQLLSGEDDTQERLALDQAERQLSHHSNSLADYQKRITEKSLFDLAAQLEVALVECVDRLHDSRRTGGGIWWRPSTGLRTALNRLGYRGI